MHYVAKRSDLEWTARDLFKAIGDGILEPNINYEYALKDAVKARHWELQSWFHNKALKNLLTVIPAYRLKRVILPVN